MTFDARKELAAFYERHFDELVKRCLEVSSQKYRYSPLNTLPMNERRRWAAEGIRSIMTLMLHGENDTDVMAFRDGSMISETISNIYFPRVSELADTSLFGAADVIDSCECALLPDEGILPLLWDDYGDDSEKLFCLVMEFRKAQKAMTKFQVNRQMEDFSRFVRFSKTSAAEEARRRSESEIYRHFYLALRSLREKTAEVYALVESKAPYGTIASQVTQMKMMEADLLSEIFRVSPDDAVAHHEIQLPAHRRSFKDAACGKGLTEREADVVSLIARGFSNKAIARRLELAESTVKNNVSNILLKLGCENRAQIVVFAAENGYFGESEEAC